MTKAPAIVTADLAERTAVTALLRGGALPENAASVARALVRAEVEGNRICGLYYLPLFRAHLDCAKVDGKAKPQVTSAQAAISVDACHGFAHPAIEAGLPHLADAARTYGIAALSIRNSYNCLALSHHVRPLAEQGLIGLCMANAPASVAPPGATSPIFGTNPLAFAVPTADGDVIMVDQSMSAVTKTEMIMRRNRGEPIPLGWAQDKAGAPTTDAGEGLLGSLLPSGGQKGANLALMVEILAASLTGSKLSSQASMFGDNEGGPPGVGQFILAIDPARFNGGFGDSIGALAERFETAGVRLPGRRAKAGQRDWSDISIEVDPDLWQRSLDLANGA